MNYYGVRQRQSGKLVSEIRIPRTKSRIWLGSFDTAKMAAVAHDVAELELKGHENGATINFPELINTYPRPVSSNPTDIKEAAQQAALSFRTATVLSQDCEQETMEERDSERKSEKEEEEGGGSQGDIYGPIPVLPPPSGKRGRKGIPRRAPFS